MNDEAQRLWDQYNAREVQEGFLHILKDGCPYLTAAINLAAEDQVIAAIDFAVLLCDSLQKNLVKECEVSKMFPTVGRALNAFAQSEYLNRRVRGRKVKVSHMLLLDCYQKYIH